MGDRWKLVVDEQGVTIAGDRFELRTAGVQTLPRESTFGDVLGVVESGQMEVIISELQAMTRRSYGQYCALARSLEILGERWALLIVRDLLVSPKQRDQLQRGLPMMPDYILSTRLRELTGAGIVAQVPVDGVVVYELTERGRALEEVVLRLGRWGARMLGERRPDEIVTADSLVMALRAIFQPEEGRGVRVSYEIHVGTIVLHARVADGVLAAGTGPLPDADLSFAPGVAFKKLLSGELGAAEAIARGGVRVTGDARLLELFTRLFRLPEPAAVTD
jgi:DNA-binding HxlR family transcriptional regulator